MRNLELENAQNYSVFVKLLCASWLFSVNTFLKRYITIIPEQSSVSKVSKTVPDYKNWIKFMALAANLKF